MAEREAAAQLNHPHIVHVYESGNADGWAYIAMEFAEGGTLAQRLSQRAGMAAPRTGGRPAGRDTRRVLHAVHEKGIVHRDLKPSNVLTDSRWHSQRLVTSDSPAGRGKYDSMSPELHQTRRREQVLNRSDQIGRTTDVYALGRSSTSC